jgi:hypothetical protein
VFFDGLGILVFLLALVFALGIGVAFAIAICRGTLNERRRSRSG